jgi:hypothetical protein
MADSVMALVAAAVAGKLAEAAVQGGKTACAALIKLIRDRCQRDKQAAKALEAAHTTGDENAIAELTLALEHLAAADADFASRVRGLWPQAALELSAAEGGVVNSVTGTVGGNLLQARDLHLEGGLHFGETRPPDQH